MMIGVGVVIKIIEIVMEVIVVIFFNKYLRVGLVVVFRVIRIIVVIFSKYLE